MIDKKETKYLVTNRSASRVVYSLPELGIHIREYQPGETKTVTYEELEALNYQPGGPALMRDYLQIQNAAGREQFCGKVEPEYNMGVEEVKQLILTGSMDEWLDCLDFAPEGVIDLIKTLSVELPLTDTRKMESFQQKKGINLANAIKTRAEEKAEEAAAAGDKPTTRRTEKTAESTAPQTPARRTSGAKYNVVNKKTEE